MTAVATDPNYIPYPRRQALRRLLRWGIAAAFAPLAQFEVIGRENLPAEGPLLVVCNHFAFLDPVVVIHILRYPLEFIGGRQAPHAPPALGWIRNLWGILPVSRGGSSRDALLRAQHFLEQKGVLVIFPEGGNWATVLRPPRPGAALLAARSGAPILPIGLDGVLDIFGNWKPGRRVRATVSIGKPFGPFKLDVRDRSNRAAIDEIGHEIMRQIAPLVSPARRGFYSDDPAVREAAKGTEIYPWADKVEF